MVHHIASQTSPCFKITKAVGLLDTFYLHMALAEQLFGSELWEMNGLPPITWPYRVMKGLIYSLMDFDLWLITMSPRWFRFRSGLLQKRITVIMAKDLGPTRTKFVLKALPTVRVNRPVADSQWGEDGTMKSRWWAMVWAAAFVALGVALVLIQQG
ncbi:hypothetical protein KVV02_000217 [Mortierella alpina]|uniref:Uncharacterized protein n=1 Tax=Mortierella alpina TaxID=64518 RepID=A0A9P8D3G7_MORAP|nr:hypothetical protein KVV02_000217 [Mortierella alpina]